MTAEAVSLTEKRRGAGPSVTQEAEAVWGCNNCGSTAMELLSDGSVECAACGAMMRELRCFLPDDPPA